MEKYVYFFGGGKAEGAGAVNPVWASALYRRIIQMFGNVVLDIHKRELDRIFDGQKKKRGFKQDTELTPEDLKQIIAGYKTLVRKKTGKDFPQDTQVQLAMAIEAVFRSWYNERAATYRRMNKISDDLGTAVNVQAMVFGNIGETSGTGVGFTRNPATGEKEFYGEFLMNAQGEDVVSGVRTPVHISELEKINPRAFAELREITTSLERHYNDVQVFYVTLPGGMHYMLQTLTRKVPTTAADRHAVEMVDEGLITKEEAMFRVELNQLFVLFVSRLDD